MLGGPVPVRSNKVFIIKTLKSVLKCSGSQCGCENWGYIYALVRISGESDDKVWSVGRSLRPKFQVKGEITDVDTLMVMQTHAGFRF